MTTRATTDGSGRVLVTGVAGFIGSHIAEDLVRDGIDVVGVDGFVDSYARHLKEDNLRWLVGQPNFRFVESDLRTADLDPLVEGVDVVVHEAAFAGLPRSWTDLASYTNCNLLALGRLVEACRRAGTRRFVHASTSSVYGVAAVGDETAPTQPASPYGITKLAAENLLLAHMAEHDFPAVILRYFSIYGPRQRPDMAFRIFIQRMLEGRPLTVYGDGLQSRSNTYIADVVRATRLAIAHGEVGEVYNIGGGSELRLRDAIRLLAEALEVEPVVQYEPARPGDQRRTAADTAKARDHLGFQPQVEPRQGLHAQLEWHLDHVAAPEHLPGRGAMDLAVVPPRRDEARAGMVRTP